MTVCGSTGGGTGTATDENTNALCSDGIDNDKDSYTDCRDFDCLEKNNSSITVCKTPEENNDALCKDGIDNDKDGYTDCKDYDCSKNTNVTVCGN